MELDLPRPPRALVLVTQALLGVLFLVGIGAIALLPAFSADVAETVPEYADLRVPLLALSIAFTLLGLIAVVLVGLLVHRIYRGIILTPTSVLWVDVLVTMFICAVILIVTAFFAISDGQAGSPFLALILVIACLGFIATSCITLVLRSLLKSAISMRSELDEVV